MTTIARDLALTFADGGRRLYLAPKRPTPINRWDYTQPHLLDETVAMGEREALLHQPLLDAFLAR
jgi:hypothetical protein